MKFPKSLSLISIGVFFTAASIYFLTPSYLFSFDALTNAMACERNEIIRWFHPNHPLYPFLGVIYYRVETLFGYEGYAIYSLARFSSLLMALGLALLTLELGKKIGAAKAATCVFFLGSCYAVWMYAVDGRAIGASAFFAMGVTANLLNLDAKSKLSTPRWALTCLLSVLYVLAHGMAVFHIFAVAFWLEWRKPASFKHGGLFYLGTVFTALAASCLIIFELVIKSFGDVSFWQWILGYASQDRGYFAESLSAMGAGLWTGWQHAFSFDERGGFIAGTAILLPTLFLGMLMAGIWQKRRHLLKTERLAFALVLWGVFATGFMAIWSPGQEGFRLHALIPWTVALALLFRDSKFLAYGQVFAATALFLINLTGPVSFAANPSNNQGLMMLKEIRRHLEPHDLFVAARQDSVPNIGALMPYFFPDLSGGSLEGRLFAFQEKNLGPFQESIENSFARQRRVFFLNDFLDSNVQRDIEARHSLPAGSLSQVLRNFTFSDSFQLSNGQKILRVTRHKISAKN